MSDIAETKKKTYQIKIEGASIYYQTGTLSIEAESEEQAIEIYKASKNTDGFHTGDNSISYNSETPIWEKIIGEEETLKEFKPTQEKVFLLIGEEAVRVYENSNSVILAVHKAKCQGIDMVVIEHDPSIDSVVSLLNKINGYWDFSFITEEEYKIIK